MGRTNPQSAKTKPPFAPTCTEASWVMGWRFCGMLKADRKLLCLPRNNFGQRMADTVGQIVDRSQMPVEALDSASWHIAITEQRYRIVPQQLIQVRKFWVFEALVFAPWGIGEAPTREEVRSGLSTSIFYDPEVYAALATLRHRTVPGREGPAPGASPSPGPGTGDGRDPTDLRRSPGTGEGATSPRRGLPRSQGQMDPLGFD